MEQNTRDHIEHIIDGHTHILSGDHVPPYLAKTFIPSPFYYLLPVSAVVKFFRFWYNAPYRGRFKKGSKKRKEKLSLLSDKNN